MFRWLTRIVSGQRAKDTEVARLKREIDANVDECKRRAAAGDQGAAQKLRDFEQTISEQSVRLLRKAPKGI